MSNQITLRSLFDSQVEDLRNKLKGLSLPKDNLLVQKTITEYLSELFNADGDYRQSLTQAEDYILQATMSLLTAQQELGSAFINQKIDYTTKEEKLFSENEPGEENPSKIEKSLNSSVKARNAVLGTSAGALLGKVAFGGWGAVFGAIAGTAVIIYLAGRDSQPIAGQSIQKTTIRQEILNEPIDVMSFMAIIGRICDSIDNLISTFRVQVNRVVDKYESQEKPTIEKEYRFLLESIQSLIGYKRTHSETEEKYLKKLAIRIDDLSECMENYDLSFIDYTGDNEYLFEMVSSPETIEKKMVLPAIVKDNVAIIKGKVFIPIE